MPLRRLALLFVIAVPPLLAQTPAQPPKFEVASIRPHQGPLQVIAGFTASGPRLTLQGYDFRLLVMEAYNLKPYQLSFAGSNVGEDADADTYYNITATAEEGTSPTREQFRQMLQSLLADRFHLRFHHEMKEMPIYALIVAKGGPKFKESSPNAPDSSLRGVHGRNQTAVLSKVTMSSFADILISGYGPRLPVVDRTGLTGTYSIKFEATPEYRIGPNPYPEDIRLNDALEDQLGLKLQVQKAPMEVLIVDHIERPTQN